MLFFLLTLTIAFYAYAGNQWQKGTGENVILGSELVSDIDTISFQNIVDPVDRLLANYRQGCKIAYLTASTLTVESGEIVLSNSGGTIRLFQQNTADTSVTWADIDTGAEATSTTCRATRRVSASRATRVSQARTSTRSTTPAPACLHAGSSTTIGR